MKGILSVIIIFLACISPIISIADTATESTLGYKGYDECFLNQIKQTCKKALDHCMDNSVTGKDVRACGDTDDACWDKIDAQCKNNYKKNQE